jgi:hypothetical protein
LDVATVIEVPVEPVVDADGVPPVEVPLEPDPPHDVIARHINRLADAQPRRNQLIGSPRPLHLLIVLYQFMRGMSSYETGRRVQRLVTVRRLGSRPYRDNEAGMTRFLISEQAPIRCEGYWARGIPSCRRIFPSCARIWVPQTGIVGRAVARYPLGLSNTRTTHITKRRG